MSHEQLIVGIISDTHGLLREEALSALSGSDYILHAGDIGKPEIVESLNNLAPTTYIRGNVDNQDWTHQYPYTETVEFLGHLIYMVHDIDQLDIKPEKDFSAVIFGHSHVPKSEYRNDVLFFNPGSAGPKRFKLPITLGKFVITPEAIKPELIVLVNE